MIPVHAVAGDCFRACVASILELPASAVPHFFRDGRGPDEAHAELVEFLRPLGLYALVLRLDAGMLAEAAHQLTGAHVLSGEASRGPHSVVAVRCQPVHDPAPGGAGPLRPFSDGHFDAVVICKG